MKLSPRWLMLAPALLWGAPVRAAPRSGRAMVLPIHLGGARLGVEVMEMSEELRRFFGAPENAGVLVNRVAADGPGAQAGLQAGDVIVEIDGKKVESSGDLIGALSDKPAGDKTTLAVVRGKARTTLVATLRERRPGNAFAFSFEGPEGRHTWNEGLRTWKSQGDPKSESDLKADLERAEKQLRELEKRLERLEKTR